jgi:RNA polymerase II subunit A C-terminal domain phosphatase SSU72
VPCSLTIGPTADQPNVFEFGTPYEVMEAELMQKDLSLYTSNGMLDILARNKKVKRAPEKWQLQPAIHCDVALTFEQRVMDALIENMYSRASASGQPLLVINIDVKDNATEAKKAGQEALFMCRAINAMGDDWLDQLEAVMDDFYRQTGRRPVYTICFA